MFCFFPFRPTLLTPTALARDQLAVSHPAVLVDPHRSAGGRPPAQHAEPRVHDVLERGAVLALQGGRGRHQGAPESAYHTRVGFGFPRRASLLRFV